MIGWAVYSLMVVGAGYGLKKAVEWERRDGFERSGYRPALMLIVVADEELDSAVAKINAALDAPSPSVGEDTP